MIFTREGYVYIKHYDGKFAYAVPAVQTHGFSTGRLAVLLQLNIQKDREFKLVNVITECAGLRILLEAGLR